MKTFSRYPSEEEIRRVVRKFCRRMIAATALAGFVIVAPAIASVSRGPLHEARLPRIDSRAVENLLRWAEGEKDSCSEEI